MANAVKISGERKLELKYFCLQYPEWKAKIKELRGGYPAVNLTGMPGGSGKTSDTVANAAIKLAEYSRKCEMVEQCCIQADSSIYQYLLKNVTEGVSYDKMYPEPPCCRDYFYKKRRLFFSLLDKKRKEV